MLRTIALSLFVVLFCSIADAEDWQLVIFHKDNIETICAKSEEVCYEAIRAIQTKKWPIAEPSSEMICERSLSCFSKQSNCIKNFNC